MNTGLSKNNTASCLEMGQSQVFVANA